MPPLVRPTLAAAAALVLLLPLAAVNAQATSQDNGASPLPPVMSRAAGEWDWSGDSLTCRKHPHTLSFTADTAFMLLRYRAPVDSGQKQEYRYRIVRFSDHTITGQIEGEQRRDATGKPVVWDLMLTGPNSYRWRRTGGSPQAVTRAIVRCKNAAPLSEAQ
jgi:hypothetical protein